MICIPSLSFAIGLTALGFWPVLPFAGIELALLYFAFYLSSLRQYREEQLHLAADEITITRSCHRHAEHTVLPRAWTRLLIQKDPRHWYSDRLFLLCCGRCTEIAAALTELEKHQLVTTLRQAGIAEARPFS